MKSLQSTYADFVRKRPRVFDWSKRISRVLGKRSPLFEVVSAYDQKKESVVFLQIGSNDGISNDPLREFIVNGTKWSGCFVEPMPHVFEQLQKNYEYSARDSLKFRNVAVSNYVGQLELYRVRASHRSIVAGYADQIASFSKQHVIRHLPPGSNPDEVIEKVSVEVTSPEKLIKDLGYSKIDLLQLDVEGYERVILDAFPIQEMQVELLIYESYHLQKADREALQARLRSMNFEVKEVHTDTVATRKS